MREKNIGNQLKLLRKHLGLTLVKFANELSLSPGYLSEVENNKKSLSQETIYTLIEKYGINPLWLLTGEGEMFLNSESVSSKHPENPANINQDDFVYIPLYDVKAAAGGGYQVDQGENIIDFLAFKKLWIKSELRANVKDLFLMYVTGDSMYPTLSDSDLILADRSRSEFKRDGIYVIGFEDPVYVKRLIFRPADIMVASDNPIYQPFTVSYDNIRIIGKVIWLAKKVP